MVLPIVRYINFTRDSVNSICLKVLPEFNFRTLSQKPSFHPGKGINFLVEFMELGMHSLVACLRDDIIDL